MKLKTLFLATACAVGLAGAASAADQAVIDKIANDLVGQGYMKVHIRNGPSSVKVEAYGPNGKVERVYDAAGNILKEEYEDRSRSGSGYDDDYDDDRDDDRDDDKDDDRDDDRDDDKDDDRDDDKDDDRDDDKDDDRDDDKDDDDDDDD